MTVSRAQSVKIAADFLARACPDYGVLEELAFACGMAAEKKPMTKTAQKILRQLASHLHTIHDLEVK